MSINMTQEDFEELIALIKLNQWLQSPFSNNLVRADFIRDPLQY